jgi:hypothetical protein
MITLYYRDNMKILQDVVIDKDLKTKAKVKKLSDMLLDEEVSLVDLIEVAKTLTGSDKGTCIEAIGRETRPAPGKGATECVICSSPSGMVDRL